MNKKVLGLMLGMMVCVLPMKPAWAGCGDKKRGGDACPPSSQGGGADFASHAPRVHVCEEVDDVVGYQKCSGFGSGWDSSVVPNMHVELGISGRSTLLKSLSLQGASTHHDKQYSYAFDGTRLEQERVASAVLELRVGGTFLSYLYGGFEIAGGAGGLIRREMQIEGFSVIIPNGPLWYASSGAYVGGKLPLGPFALRGEIMTGLRALMLEVTTMVGDCEHDSLAWELQFAFEPRLGVDWWASEHVTVSVTAGMDVVDTGALYGGVQVGFHTYAYDGAESLW